MSDSLSAADNVKTHEIGGGLTKKQAKKNTHGDHDKRGNRLSAKKGLA